MRSPRWKVLLSQPPTSTGLTGRSAQRGNWAPIRRRTSDASMFGTFSCTSIGSLLRLHPPREAQQVLVAVERVVVRPRTGRHLPPDRPVAVEDGFQLHAFAPGQRRQLLLQLVYPRGGYFAPERVRRAPQFLCSRHGPEPRQQGRRGPEGVGRNLQLEAVHRLP